MVSVNYVPIKEFKVKNELFLTSFSPRFQQEKEICRSKEAVCQKITVVLPAFNEKVSIGSTVLHTKRYADRVIMVDNGSSDRTVEIAEKAGAEVIVHETNKGKGMALKTGFEAAEGSDILVTMDSDGQHNPADIPIWLSRSLKAKQIWSTASGMV
ncbi:glycosyltransferase family 2 protein [Methanosarcina acetivorans]|uniref:Dolichyl-phosphate beta-D-mannosyltransferase related protein n=1 Tax=Methanosarcina acetivorans (strain ATCC 35395 / DSM 2834 / JCM 12185 / C2A) TaxID=188937 RepID=Q8TN28_METAC|nr:glycosyltransferase family 2 protein [Methanosarcina acetivorans]AAM05851.1 dolichyl-phosphate beta-D-mannosyltransferase related protein [Methanosarcina acetivorans C2A]